MNARMLDIAAMSAMTKPEAPASPVLTVQGLESGP